MNNSIKNIAIFIAGAAIGSVITWKMIKQKYADLAQEEIDSVKETFSNSERRQSDGSITPEQKEAAAMAKEKPNVKDYVEYLNKNRTKVDYTGYFKGKQVEESETDDSYGEKQEDSAMVLHEPDQPDVVIDKPCVIAPEEFGEMDGYNTISLTYYADNVLADDMDELVEDVDETVGLDSLNHFGEYEDDSVFVRNDRLRSDYEILRDNRTYEDWVLSKRHPHSAEE